MRLRLSLMVVIVLAVPLARADEPVGERRAEELTSRAHTVPPDESALESLPGEHESGRVLAMRYAVAALAGAACLMCLYVAFSRTRSGTGRR